MNTPRFTSPITLRALRENLQNPLPIFFRLVDFDLVEHLLVRLVAV